MDHLIMNHSTNVYLVYGVPFYYDAKTKSNLELFDLMVPDKVKEGAKREWRLLETRPHPNGYFLFDFPNDNMLILGCWRVTHGANPQLLDMPTEYTKKGFVDWCVNRNIDTGNIGFYMITNDV